MLQPTESALAVRGLRSANQGSEPSNRGLGALGEYRGPPSWPTKPGGGFFLPTRTFARGVRETKRNLESERGGRSSHPIFRSRARAGWGRGAAVAVGLGALALAALPAILLPDYADAARVLGLEILLLLMISEHFLTRRKLARLQPVLSTALKVAV